MSRIILARAPLPHDPAELVLVHLEFNRVTPWVTWMRNLRDGDTYWGHYHSTYEDALTEFQKRCRDKGAGPIAMENNNAA